MKILIVEDDPMISEIYQKKFSEGDFKVSLATSGEQVLKMVEQESPDVILLDLMLPKMNGFEIIENIRIISNMKMKEHASITNRAVFKCLDTLDII